MLLELKEGEFLTVYQIVDEVIKFHMKDLCTVMMLSKTIHQLHHTGQYTIPKNATSLHIGKYKDLIKSYAPYLVESDLNDLIYFLNTEESEEVKECLEEEQKAK